MNFQIGDVAKVPIIKPTGNSHIKFIKKNILLSQTDWDSYETSWDFTTLPLLRQEHRAETLSATYASLREHWREMTLETQRLEEENNRIFIEAYGLEDELTPEVPLSEITLTCNPHYRYPDTRRKTYTDEAREAMLLADTMQEFISYSVGCMFGRYSLDVPGLILANQGETLEDYLHVIARSADRSNPTLDGRLPRSARSDMTLDDPHFPPDEDNVIPLLDEGWFEDDIAERFKKFLRVTFGEQHYEENLHFLEDAIGRDIRTYFLRQFYKHHVRMYKKRPIYWLFSSPKGSFNALIYMHRYQPDTVSIILNDYLRQFMHKLNAHKAHLESLSISTAASQSERTRALRQIEKINQVLAELKEYEDEILYPLATQRIEIDLDDGVKVNYRKYISFL